MQNPPVTGAVGFREGAARTNDPEVPTPMEAELADTTPSNAPIAGRRLWDDLRRAVGKAVVGADEPDRKSVV